MAAVQLLELIAGTLGVAPTEVNEASEASNTRKWDSMRHLMLITELESTYGILLSDQEIMEAVSVARIRALLHRHGVTP